MVLQHNLELVSNQQGSRLYQLTQCSDRDLPVSRRTATRRQQRLQRLRLDDEDDDDGCDDAVYDDGDYMQQLQQRRSLNSYCRTE